jgi:hypothetical protein
MTDGQRVTGLMVGRKVSKPSSLLEIGYEKNPFDKQPPRCITKVSWMVSTSSLKRTNYDMSRSIRWHPSLFCWSRPPQYSLSSRLRS